METERIAVTTVDLPIGSIISIDARLYPAVVWGGAEGVIVKQGDQYILELPEQTDTNYVKSITCDCCRREYSDSQEFLHIDDVGGYNSAIGDDVHYQCDLCSFCVKNILGKYLRYPQLRQVIMSKGQTRRVDIKDLAQFVNIDKSKTAIGGRPKHRGGRGKLKKNGRV